MIPFVALFVFHKNFYPMQGTHPGAFVYLFKKQNIFGGKLQEIISDVRFRNMVTAGLCRTLVCIFLVDFWWEKNGKKGGELWVSQKFSTLSTEFSTG